MCKLASLQLLSLKDVSLFVHKVPCGLTSTLRYARAGVPTAIMLHTCSLERTCISLWPVWCSQALFQLPL